MPLETELKYFEERRADLWKNHPGKFVVIKGNELVGAFDTALAAYEAGVSRFGTEPFLMKQVFERDVAVQAPALYTGLVGLGGGACPI
jgi:hypothetical protein